MGLRRDPCRPASGLGHQTGYRKGCDGRPGAVVGRCAWFGLIALGLAYACVWHVWETVVKAPKGQRDWEMLFAPVTGLVLLVAAAVYILLVRGTCTVRF